MLHDIRFALRSLRRHAGFTFLASVTLATGIAANAVVFAVVDAVLLRPLPYAAPDRLVRLERAPLSFAEGMDVSLDLTDLPEFEAAGVYQSGGVNLGDPERPRRVRAAVATRGFFDALGVAPRVGRLYTREASRPGANQFVVLGDELWRSHFNGDPSVVGRRIELNAQPFEVVAVMPPGFDFPDRSAAWIPPLSDRQATGQAYAPKVLARLAAGVSPARARIALDRLNAEEAARPPGGDPSPAAVHLLREDLVGNVRPVLLLLLAAVAVLLLVACANTANLMLSRMLSRQRELAVRSAVGASRSRLLRLVFSEAAVLSAVAAALAIPIAAAALAVLRVQLPEGLHRVGIIGLDVPVLAVAAACALSAALLISLAAFTAFPGCGPFVRLFGRRRREHLSCLEALRGAAGTAGGTWQLVRMLLATAEVAATVTLAVCALVLVQTMARFAAVDMGVQPDDVMTLRLTLPLGRYGSPEKSAAFQDAVLDALAGVSGVTASSTSSVMPGSAEVGVGFKVNAEGFPAPKAPVFPRFASVSPGYFETMGIPLHQGRVFTGRDGRDAARVAILSEDAVRLLFPPDVDPIGRHVVVAAPQPVSREIVGIVADVRMHGPEGDRSALVYVPIAQQPPFGTTYLALRTASREPTIAAVVSAIRRLDPTLPPYDIRPLRALTDATIADRRFAMLVMVVFAVITLALAMVGLHGVIAHLVEERRKDMGIRVALGADRRRIHVDVLSKGLRHGLVGGGVGAALSLAAGRVLGSHLPGVVAPDASLIFSVAVVVTALSVVAALVPARRATSVDPLLVLKAE